ncbi:TrbG/VirB9 family P-type conjugative transfer protein [Gymnodinialimonas sp. 2305UL16-5]|uniref:TrbG/VirB9 family P-type conjugative transfer protein n=1 Tax=Gymnodinialimonas mytili TaxID=3126503 RepID=UPI0030AC72DA
MRIQALILSLAVMVAAGSAAAEIVPAGSHLDHRIRVTEFVDGQVYAIQTSLTRATTVEFQEGERIVSIVAGDTEGFDFQSVPGDRVFAVKPTLNGATTNVTVYTNRRSYYFTLRVTTNPFYVLRFTYPEDAEDQPTRSAGPINANYGADQRNDITPVSVWDDGEFTYFRFPGGAPVPAIFRVTNGRERSVNSQLVADRLVRVSGTAQQWALRMGNIEVCIAELFDGQ